jgi:glucose 1-dehydrogenase
MGDLENKVAVITGGSRGLGLAMARELARLGAAVVLAARSEAYIQQAVAQITAEGGKAAGRSCDVSRREQVYALREYALQTFGRLDIWINNAGVSGPYGPTVEVSPLEFHKVVQTNILGVYHGSLAAMQHFQEQKSGKLVNLIGAGASSPTPYQSAYGSSKAWVKSFTMALAKETRGSGVSVFAFQPGMVTTDLLMDVQVVSGHEQRLKVFPKVIRVLARPPEEPARKLAWVVSSATDGKTAKIYGMPFFWHALRGLLGLLFHPKSVPEVKMTSLPAWTNRQTDL